MDVDVEEKGAAGIDAWSSRPSSGVCVLGSLGSMGRGGAPLPAPVCKEAGRAGVVELLRAEEEQCDRVQAIVYDRTIIALEHEPPTHVVLVGDPSADHAHRGYVPCGLWRARQDSPCGKVQQRTDTTVAAGHFRVPPNAAP